MTLRPWHDRLARAGDESQVLEIARDFLQLWLPTDFAALPKKLRPWKMAQPDDVTGYAFVLTRARLAALGDANPAVDVMASFFADASMRIATLYVREPERALSGAEPLG